MPRGYEHTSAIKKAKERDAHTCQICGSTEHTEGHHIIDFAFGGAGDEDNIITLCRDCHQSVHKGIINLFKF